MRTVSGQPVDRIPIFAPIPWHPLAPEPSPDDWKALPNYRVIASRALACCDFYVAVDIPERMPIGGLRKALHGIPTGVFDRRFLLVPPERVRAIEETSKGERRRIRYRVRTPKGDLSTTDVITEGVDTIWTHEPLIKDAADVERIRGHRCR